MLQTNPTRMFWLQWANSEPASGAKLLGHLKARQGRWIFGALEKVGHSAWWVVGEDWRLLGLAWMWPVLQPWWRGTWVVCAGLQWEGCGCLDCGWLALEVNAFVPQLVFQAGKKALLGGGQLWGQNGVLFSTCNVCRICVRFDGQLAIRIRYNVFHVCVGRSFVSFLDIY